MLLSLSGTRCTLISKSGLGVEVERQMLELHVRMLSAAPIWDANIRKWQHYHDNGL